MDYSASAPLLTRPLAADPAPPVAPLVDLAALAEAPVPREEELIADPRAGLTPAQMVERKLALLLKSGPVPVSQMMTRSRTSRNHC